MSVLENIGGRRNLQESEGSCQRICIKLEFVFQYELMRACEKQDGIDHTELGSVPFFLIKYPLNISSLYA